MRDLLGFSLPEFARWSWVSDCARDTWEPRMVRIIRAWLEVEWLSVAAGIRRCGATFASSEELRVLLPRWQEYGLVPVEQTLDDGTFSAGRLPTAAAPFRQRIVVGKRDDTLAFQEAWKGGDDQVVGESLGYPPCCINFCRETWSNLGIEDTTWPMAAPSDHSSVIEVGGPPETNILWRSMGIRAVPHLPCGFECSRSIELARKLVGTGHAAGFSEEMNWLLEILSWPVEWSALHGIAEIKTPILRISTRTDATAKKYTLRRTGNTYPAEGAHGLSFPYQTQAGPLLTLSPGFRRGLANPINQANGDA